MKSTTPWSHRIMWSHKFMFAALALAFTAHAALGQQASKPSGKDSLQIESELRAGVNFHSSFASSEFASDGGRIVQGAPFSAVGTKETTQILSDGRRVVRRMTTSIYRNAQGSTRFDWGNSTKTIDPAVARFPIIYDAVTGTFYLGRRAIRSQMPLTDAARRKVKIITPESPPDDITKVLGETIEPLGTKTIEGVAAEGVRVTTTIPMTEIGGRQSNKVVYERWYSQELRRNVLLKVTDPRFGEAVYSLTNIDRTEPAPELFQVTAESAPATSKLVPGAESAAPVSIKLERGGHVAVDNRTTGRIRIIGWDRDTIEATATSERGAEAVRFVVKDSPERYVWLKADYLKREGDETPRPESAPKQEPTQTVPTPQTPPTLPQKTITRPTSPGEFRLPDLIQRSVTEKLGGMGADDNNSEPPMRDGRPIEVHLEVRVPRYAEIELIKVIRSRVEVTGVETPILVLGDKSDVILKDVREAGVRTRSGAVEIEDATGSVEVVTTSGPVQVRRAGGDVRVLSISGKIEIDCVRGRVNVDSADGTVALNNVQGDVEANASNSDISFAGAIRDDGRYHLKTMSGTIEMAVRDKAPGFTASLSSYSGSIENEFQLQIKEAGEQHAEGNVNRRIIGRHGDGQAQITLDSFDGRIRLYKLAPAAVRECKIQN
jgi:hypothetical protein